MYEFGFKASPKPLTKAERCEETLRSFLDSMDDCIMAEFEDQKEAAALQKVMAKAVREAGVAARCYRSGSAVYVVK